MYITELLHQFQTSILNMSKILYPKTIDHLGQSDLVEILGSGGFANVYRYKCKQSHSNGDCQKCYVVKKLRVDDMCFVNKEDMIQKLDIARSQLFSEYEIGKMLMHDNILQTIDIDAAGTSLILEDFIGIDFLDYLNLSEPRNVPLMVKLFTQVLDGLDYMHNKKGIAHMDIKLENIIWNREHNAVKIIDFGHARVFRRHGEDLMYHNGYCGTESYFPPEYFRNEYYMPAKVDAWCCGVVLYNLVYDTMPWEMACTQSDNRFANYMDCLTNGFSVSHLFPDMLPHGLTRTDASYVWTVLMGLLHPDASKRYSVRKANALLKVCSFMTE